MDFLSQYTIISIDKDIAKSYGEIKAELVKKGSPIPENDIWIAATAKTHQFVLSTFDAHFSNIEGLQVQP
jgi:tRNA(fMet)-specific endonuclease VapC